MATPANNGGELPSGVWVGFTNDGHGGPRRGLTLELTFLEGRIRGTGSDDRGSFSVYGTYEGGAAECALTQVREGVPDIQFTGYREPRTIWGLWTAQPDGRGGFQIWPRGEAPSDLLEESSLGTR